MQENLPTLKANQSACKKSPSKSSQVLSRQAKMPPFMLLRQVQYGLLQTFFAIKNNCKKPLKFGLVFSALIFLSLTNLKAQPADSRPIIKYVINNYASISKAACDTCPLIAGKPLRRYKPIPMPPVAAINAIPGFNIDQVPGLAAPNFLGGGSPEIKGLVKSVAGMTDKYARYFRKKSDSLYFRSGAQGVAVSKSGKIFTSSSTIFPGIEFDFRNARNGIFSFNSTPARLPSFNSTSNPNFLQSPAQLFLGDNVIFNEETEVAYFAVDPNNEKIIYVSLRNPLAPSIVRLARKNADGKWVSIQSLPYNVWGALAVDNNGNLWIADPRNHIIVKADFDDNGKSKSWQTIAGKFGTSGFVNDDDGEDARFNKPSGICVDKDGNVYVGDAGNNVIRKIDDDGEVTTYAGNKDGIAGWVDDDDWDDAKFSGPTALAYNELTKTLYVVDATNKLIRAIDDDRAVSTLAGNAGSANPVTDPKGFANNFYYVLAQLNMDPDEAKFDNPTGIAIDPSGFGLYVSDGNYIKYVNTSETIFNITSAIGDSNALVLGIPFLPPGIKMNSNNGSFFGVPLVPWKPTTYGISVTNHVGTSLLNGFITFEVVDCPEVPDTIIDNRIISLNQLPFTWNGQVLKGAGTAIATLQSLYGCDSVVKLNLVLKPEFNYNAEPYIFSLGQKITPVFPTTAGSKIDTFSISPALPAGLTLNSQTGAITGTPLVSSTSQPFPVIGPRTPSQYPAPWSLSTYGGADITQVQISDVNNKAIFENNTAFQSLQGSAGAGIGTAGAYSDFSGLGAIKMQTNTPYAVRLSNALSGGNIPYSLNQKYGVNLYMNSYAVYIDYNRDGDFADAGERVYISAAPQRDAHTEGFNLNMPVTAMPGVTKMRIYCVEAPTRPRNYFFWDGTNPVVTVTRTTEQALSFYPFFGNISNFGSGGGLYDFQGWLDNGEFEDYNIDIINLVAQSYVISGSNQLGSAQSIIRIAVNKPSTSSSDSTICSTDLPYTWNGLVFSQAGTQTAHLINLYGADSAATLNLKVKQATSSVIAVANCGPYSYQGKVYTTSGDYAVHITNAVGCDSAIIFRFRQKSTSSTTNITVLPSQLNYHWNGLTFTRAGLQTAHLINAENCDSAATLALRVEYGITYTDTSLLPVNKAITPFIPKIEGNYGILAPWNELDGFTISPALPNGLQINVLNGVISGTPTQLSPLQTYTVTLHQDGAKPSTFKLSVGVPSASTNTISNCGPYTFNGVLYSTPITVSVPLKNQYGFDSTAMLILTIRNPSATTTSIFAKKSELSILWNGISLTQEGDKTIALKNLVDCDSVITVNVALTPDVSYPSPKILLANQAMVPIVPVDTGGVIPSVTGNVSTLIKTNYLSPISVAVDAQDNSYVGDLNGTIYKINRRGIVSTVTGFGTTKALLAIDKSGNIYVADKSSNRIIKKDNAGTITVLANVSSPTGIAVDSAGNVYYSEGNNHRIRKISSTGTISTLAGGPAFGYTNGNGATAKFNTPSGLSIDTAGNVYVADLGNNRIRKITPAGDVTTFAGNGAANSLDGTSSTASFNAPMDIASDNLGNKYVVDNGSSKIRKINAAGMVSTLAGTTAGYQDGSGTQAKFNLPMALTTDSHGNVYVADKANAAIRQINAINYTIKPALVNGLQLNEATGIISGIPTDTLLQPVTYTIRSFNKAGADTTNILIGVCNIMKTSFTKDTCNKYIWNDSTYTSSTIHTRTLKNRGGCDSVVTMRLTIRNSTFGLTTTANACGSYLWKGTTYTQTGYYTKVYTNAVGCDSTIYLNLTIRPITTNNLFVDINPSQLPYKFRDSIFVIPGTKTQVLPGANYVGCDSIINMTVRISALLPNISYATRDTILYWEKTIAPPIVMTNTGTAVLAAKLGERDTLISFLNGPGDQIKTIRGLDGTYYAKVFNSSNIYKLTSSGAWTIFAGFGGAVNALTMDKLGNLYAAINETGSQVRKITPAGSITTLPNFTTFSGIDGLAFDADNNLLIHSQLSQYQFRITTYNLSTSQFVQRDLDNTPFFGFGLEDMKTDTKGNIYMYKNSGSNVVKIRPNGQMSGIGQTYSPSTLFQAGNGVNAMIPTVASIAIDTSNDNLYIMAYGYILRVDTSLNVYAITGRWFDQYKDQIFRVDNGKISIVNSSTGKLYTVNVHGVGSIPFMDNYGVIGVPTPQNATVINFRDFDKRIRLDSSGAIVGTARANYSSTGTIYADNYTTAYSIIAANRYGIGTAPMTITTKGISYKMESFVTTTLPFVWKGRSFNAPTDTATFFATNKTAADDTLYILHLVYEGPPQPVIIATGNCAAGNITLTANTAKNAIQFDGANFGLIKNVKPGASGLGYYGVLSIPGSNRLNFVTSFEAWIKPTVVTGKQYIVTRDTVKTHGTFFGLAIEDGKLVYEFTKGYTTPFTDYKLSSSINLLPNVWTHVAASYYDSTMYIFINGQFAGSKLTQENSINVFYNEPGSSVGIFPDFCLGGLGSKNGFKGEMDEFRTWGARRDAAAIQSTMNLSVAPFSTSLALYYRFDGDITQSARDYSPSNRTATFIKPATSVSPSMAPVNFTYYLWTTGASSPSITVNPTANTNYSVYVTDYKNASASSATLVVSTRVSTFTEVIRACGSPYTWHGTAYNNSITGPTWTGKNQYGCDSIVTLNLTLLPLPTPTITGANSICPGGTATLSTTAFSSYAWLPGGQTTANITVQPNFSTAYTLKVTDANGCQATVSKTIAVGKPSSFTEKISACGSYTWHGTTYTSSNNTATWVGVNAAGCDSVVTLNLRIDALPVPAIVPANGATICSGNPLQITARASGKQLNLDGNSRMVADAMGIGPTTGFTLEGWVKFTSIGTDQSIISQTSGNTPLPFDAWLNTNGKVSFAVGNGGTSGTITSNYALSPNTWYHLAFSYFNNRSYMYINGSLAALGITAIPITGKLNNFMIGNNESLSRPMVGAVDEFRVWDLVLSQAQISGNMNASSKPDATGLVAYYKFDEGDSDLPANTADMAATATFVGNAKHGLSTAPLLYQSYNWTDGSTKPVYYAVDANTLYTVTVTDVNGCSAPASGKAVVSSPSTFTETIKACGPYTWHGVTYTSSNNTAKWTTQNAAGCDSVVALNLTVGTPSASTETAAACNYFVWHGTTYTTSTTGAAWHTINASGCDSVVTLHLTITNAVERTDTVTTCGSYRWHDSTYTASTKTPVWYGTGKNGCDSIVHLDLSIADAPIAKINAVNRVTTNICQVGIVLQNANEAYTKYATGVNSFSSEMANNQNQQIIGKPDTYPNYGDLATAWSTRDDQSRREFIELTYDNPRPVNFIDIYETLNSGTIDTVYVKNPSTGAFEVVYSGKAEMYNVPVENRISFPVTTFAVSTIRIAINSVDLPAQKSIDAVAIGISNNNSYRWSNGSSVDTLLATRPGKYILTATNEFGCSVSDTIDLGTFELQQSTDDLLVASANRTATKNVVAGAATIFAKDCELIASLLPTGTPAVTGSVDANVWIETAQPATYVKRHYQLTPAINAGTATATVTLYFTQQEFTGFNAVNSIKLPIDATDAANNRAHLLIEKHGGVSSDGSGLPATYTGSSATIAPTSVNWNTTASRWEVTFSMAGVSGFFARTKSDVLPVTLVTFAANLAGNKTVALQWNVVEQVGIKNYVVERSIDGNSFSAIGSVAANSLSATGYGYTDADLPAAATVYYRLRIVGVDGTVTYSPIVPVRLGGSSLITIYPNPARDFVWLQGGGINLIGTDAFVTDLQGRTISKTRIGAWPLLINTASLADGVYLIRLDDNQTLKLVVGK